MSDYESSVIKKVVSKYIAKDSSILDIACGLGGKMLLLKDAGYQNVRGVEINEDSVHECTKKGLNVVTFDKFKLEDKNNEYDVIFLSHIIEHFEYRELIEFMETYLQYLKKGGYVIIITPVFNSCFYDAFDHVKPYSHIGILNIFGDELSTEPCKSKYRLEMLDLYYIRMAFQLKFYRALTLHTRLFRLPRTINRLLHLVYRLSFRTIGSPSAWIGVFQKKT